MSYWIVTVYSAERKKGLKKYFPKRDYTEEEFKKAADRVKYEQRKINAEYKSAQAELKKDAILQPIEPLNPAVSSKIKLKLDKNTGNSTVIFGASKTGKSFAAMHIYKRQYAKDPNMITTLFSASAHIAAYRVDKTLLKCGVFNAKAAKYIRLQKYINSKTKNAYSFCNIFDDIIDAKYSKMISNLLLVYRNSNISTLMCLQAPKLLAKHNRANVSNILIFGTNSIESAEELITMFLKPYFVRMGIITKDEQMAFYKAQTKDHGFFYIHNASDTITMHRLNKE